MQLGAIHQAVASWFEAAARDLPWRRAGTTAWGVLVSEVMSHQTPVARVAPVWEAWLRRWPRPSLLAQARTAEVLRAWGRLGYPRRALRLQECAVVLGAHHHDAVPDDEETLLGLPGVGPYTAAAVRAFAFGHRTAVLDTNIRRVLTRLIDGEALPPPHLGAAERIRAGELLPTDEPLSVAWNAGLMELGALVCTARSPDCGACPVAAECRWLAAGNPADRHAARRRTQPWHGTDRQVRGRVMQLLREHPDPAGVDETALLEALDGSSTPPEQARRASSGLLDDGLIARTGTATPRISLPRT